MAVQTSFGGLDYSIERTNTGVWMADLTSANFDGQVLLQDNIQVGIQGISLIAYQGKSYPANVVITESVPPGDVNAQREKKWRVSYADNVTGRRYALEVGGADLALLQANSDLMDLALPGPAAFVANFEAGALSLAGNAVTVIEIRFVGRTI